MPLGNTVRLAVVAGHTLVVLVLLTVGALPPQMGEMTVMVVLQVPVPFGEAVVTLILPIVPVPS